MFSEPGQFLVDTRVNHAGLPPFRALRQSEYAAKSKGAQRTPNKEQSC